MVRSKRVRTRLGWRWLTAWCMAISLTAGIMVSDNARAENAAPVRTSIVKKYLHDLTSAAEQGRFNSSNERQDEINRAIAILARARQNNPVVLTDSQVLRDIIAAGVARRLAEGNVPAQLVNRRLFKLDLESLFRDSKSSTELQSNLALIISEVSKSNSQPILLIDPVQSLVGTAAAFDGAISGFMREAIKNEQLQVLGASTHVTFEQNISSDETLALLFAGLEMKEVAEAKGQSADNSSQQDSPSERFVGVRISPDLRELLDGRNAPARVHAILQVDDTNNTELRANLARYGVTVTAEMARFGSLAVDLPAKAIDELVNNTHTRYVSLDRPVKSFGHLQTTTGEAAMWSETGNLGLNGSGIGIAILDSGISKKHHSIINRVAYSQDFTGEGTVDDVYGHGTYVAAIAAGNDIDSPGLYSGAAPAANLINLRVLNSQGTGTVSAVLNALDVVMSKRATYNIRVVNMSMGMPAIDSYQNDPLCRAVRHLVDAGIIVVAAAGNNGKDANNP